ncbi:glycoside hydrolase family 32 protein [Niallia sp. 01092]|uniref:glycoside hydrolase family 32 protein n=1 Tax=unclassified Niallia TaxID=2837522 RepID=UPI003FD23DAE
MLKTNRLKKAEESLKETMKKMNNQYRLGYHIMAPANWINDPNGLVQFNGEYHVFYQHHPYDENWGPMHWGHVKSKDLVHWEHLPIALAPGDTCDKDGCFSGSAVDNDGELTLIYTGHHYVDKEKDVFFQNQNIAVSKDGVTFEKVGENPVIAEPPEDSSHHFRDPKVWKHNGEWYMILGNATKEEVGRVILYKSPDLRKWEYIGVLAQSDGTLGYMWECPDFFELDGKYVLLFSPQGMEAEENRYQNLFQTGSLIGDYNYETNEFVYGEFTELDHGHDFYAVQTLLDDKGRRIAIGWMDMWESDMPTKKDGWAGALTLPRVLTLSKEGILLMNPVEELVQLRETAYPVLQNKSVVDSCFYEAKEVLLEVKAVFDLKSTEAEAIEVNLIGSGSEVLTIQYHKTTQKLTLDCSNYGKEKDGVRSTKLASSEELSLRIFIDRSSIEIFVNDGEATMTSRIYPKEERTGIEIVSENGVVNVKELAAWKLKDTWK